MTNRGNKEKKVIRQVFKNRNWNLFLNNDIVKIIVVIYHNSL